MNKDEIILLYGFKNNENTDKILSVLKEVHIKVKILNEGDYNEKVGYLLGLKGFNKSTDNIENTIQNELMIFQNIKGKRLDFVLDKLKENKCIIPKFKSVATPFNIHWSLKRLYETMKKEHSALNS